MIDEHDSLIGLIYEGVSDETQWNLALKRVANLANAAGVGLGMQTCGPISSATSARTASIRPSTTPIGASRPATVSGRRSGTAASR